MPQYGSFFRRFAAALIDGLILFIPSLAVGFASKSTALNFALGVVLGVLYRPFFDSSALSGTPGKAIMGLAVLTETGQIISFKQAMIRFLVSYISGFMLCIGYLIQPFTAKRQTLHDIIADTVVIKRDPPDVNYFTVWKAQFDYVISKL